MHPPSDNRALPPKHMKLSRPHALAKALLPLWAGLLLVTLAQAQIPVALETTGELKAALSAPADPARGQAGFEECAGCLRKDAAGRANSNIPRLSGQHASVIVKQLVDIRSGLRLNPPMKPWADDPAINAQAIADIAVYLQGLPTKVPAAKPPASDLARGQTLFEKDCAGCHGAKGEGLAALFYPMLAAQHASYLVRELNLMRNGERGNSNPAMVSIIKPYAADDLQAVADYLSRLPAPAR